MQKRYKIFIEMSAAFDGEIKELFETNAAGGVPVCLIMSVLKNILPCKL